MRLAVVILVASTLLPACSVKKLAVRSVGSAMAGGGGTYARDDDPELVASALPFGLKTIEGLLEADPENRDLLLGAASGFTQYATAFVSWEADYVESSDSARADAMRARAKRLLRRARGYGLRGLGKSFEDSLRADAERALAPLAAADVPLLYWTAAAWGSAIGLSKDEPDLVADLPLVEALLRRALALDESWGAGQIHDAMIAFEGGRPAAAGGSIERARRHYERALELAHGQRVSPLVTWAEVVSIGQQNRTEFDDLLGRALALDPDTVPEQRLANLLVQKRARWLRSRADELFLE